MSRRNREYVELLHNDFDESKYISFIKDLLNLSNTDINLNYTEIKPSQKQYNEDIEYYKYFAKYKDGFNNIGAFIVNIRSTNERSKQRNFIANLMKDYGLDASLVAFISDNDSSWRISFVRKELSFTDKGIKQDITPARRYSYLVGKNESIHTAQEYLLKLLDIEDRRIKIEDIESVFDVEKVTKRFFEEYKEQFLKLQEYLDKNKDFKTESIKYDFDSTEFAKRLMGQIVFLYFLQKKGWLGVQLVPEELSKEEFNILIDSNDSVCQNLLNEFYELNNDVYKIKRNELRNAIENDVTNFTNIFINSKYDMSWGTGDKQFIRTIYTRSQVEHKNFFDDYLEPFFYDGLNHKRDNQYFALFNCKIPFLNGGLFEPLNDYRWSSAEFNIPNKYFSNDDKTGILDFLDLYNFTIDEEEPLEKEIAVDPEMLGKIFENLLEVNVRKSKGAFYTPREIVYYMCQESLANYLVNKVGTNYDETIQFIKYGDLISQIDTEYSDSNDYQFKIGSTILNNLFAIDNALENVKVADPAVGSGAFPLGILTEIVKARNAISTYVILAHEKGLVSDDEFNSFKYKDIYELKKETIENCIYAVDSELSAVDIAKLRLWLSLIVDYPNIEEPKPLPNLDCKIMQGNSLIDEFEGVPLFSEKMLLNNLKNYKRNESQIASIGDIHLQQTLFDDTKNIEIYMETMLNLQKEYFITSDNKMKKELKEKIDKIQIGLVEESLKSDYKKLEKFKEIAQKRQKPWFIWKLEFFEVFKNNGGFDIVIGNPPYVDSETMTKYDKKNRDLYSKKYKTTKGNWDLFIPFIELGYILLNVKGTVTFIIPNKLISANYSKTLRELMNTKDIIELRDYSNVKVFKEASVYPVTMLAQNIKTTNNIKMTMMKTIDSIEYLNIIEKNIFKKNINWDKYFSKNTEITYLINKIDSNTKLMEFDVEIKGAATVNDAYTMKEIMKECTNLKEEFKFVNTGTIDPYQILWGIKSTQYIKGKYSKPVINKKILKKKLPIRYADSIKDKIIIGGMAKRLECVFATEDYVPGKSTIVIKSDTLSLKYLLAVLNSKLMSFYYCTFYNSSSLEGGFYSVNTEQIKKLPIIYEKNKVEILEKMVDQLNVCYDDKIINKIDLIIYDIYNLTEKEIKIIEDEA